jgi:hypothetical protein
MVKAIPAALFAAWLAAIPSTTALAWDYPGHRIVGAIADAVLQQHYPKTYTRVSELLEIKRPDDTRQKRSLREVAVFPDCAKKGNEPYCGRPSSEEEKSYAEKNQHNDKFHYTDLPLQQPKYVAELLGTDDIDVVQMINFITAYLRTIDSAPPERPSKKGIDLTDTEAVWLLTHLVGDIHQPLHVGAKYFDKTCETAVDPNAIAGGMKDVAQTVGGNLIYLTAAPPAVPPAANLHFYWDGAAVVRAMRITGTLSSEQEYAKMLAAAPPPGWQTSGPAETWAEQWASEAMPLAAEAHDRLQIRKGGKPAPFSNTGGCTWEATVDPAYEEWAANRAEEQLKKAGFRLAALLKAIFEP